VSGADAERHSPNSGETIARWQAWYQRGLASRSPELHGRDFPGGAQYEGARRLPIGIQSMLVGSKAGELASMPQPFVLQGRKERAGHL